MKPKTGFRHASRASLDAWISGDISSLPEQVIRPALSLLSAHMVLVLAENGGSRIVRGYVAQTEPDIVVDQVAKEFLASRYQAMERQARPTSSKEMIEKSGLLISFQATLLPHKGGEWCVGLFDVRLVLKMPRPIGDIDHVDRRILQLLYKGFSGKEIGIAIGLSHRTIEHRTEKLKLAFGARTIAQLVALSIASGFGQG